MECLYPDLEHADWWSAVGVSAFRCERAHEPERSAETDATHPRPFPRFRWKVARTDAGMPYILISTQIRLVRINHEQRARLRAVIMI